MVSFMNVKGCSYLNKLFNNVRCGPVCLAPTECVWASEAHHVRKYKTIENWRINEILVKEEKDRDKNREQTVFMVEI